MPADLELTFAGPSPIATALSALSVLAVAAILFQIVAFLNKSRDNGDDQDGLITKILNGLGATDRFIVQSTSRLTGTRHPHQVTRVVLLISFFLAMTILGATLPWPWGLLPLIGGMIGIFGVFRHYSRHEDELVYEVPKEKRLLLIEGHLHREVVIAVSFLFVFAPIAFAQLQVNGYGFEVAPEAGPFAFVIYTAFETLKSGSIVDYYDLYAERVGFAQISTVDTPSSWAKYGIMGYRLSLNLVVLATLKRLLDIAGRRSRGLDMRYINDLLRRDDEEGRERAIVNLENFALQSDMRLSRLNAVSILKDLTNFQARSDFLVDEYQVLEASRILYDYSVSYGDLDALRSSISGYQRSLNVFTREEDPENWAITKENLGEALLALGRQANDPHSLEDAVSAFEAATEVYTKEDNPNSWARVKTGIGRALAELCLLRGEPDEVAGAIDEFNQALTVLKYQDEPELWRLANRHLGHAYVELGRYRDDEASLSKAIEIFRQIAEAEMASGDAKEAAGTTGVSLSSAFISLGEVTDQLKPFQIAASESRKALELLDGKDDPVLWAKCQSNLAIALSGLGVRRQSLDDMDEGIKAFEKAIPLIDRYTDVQGWLITMGNLANAYQNLGHVKNDVEYLSTAASIYYELLEVVTRLEMPVDWAQTKAYLGALRQHMFEISGLSSYAEDAASAFEDALKVRTKQDYPNDWASLSISLADAYRLTGEDNADRETLRRSIDLTLAVLKAADSDEVSTDLGRLQNVLGTTYLAFANLTDSETAVRNAIAAYRASLEVRTEKKERDAASDDLAFALIELGERTNDTSSFDEAITILDHVLETYDVVDQPIEWAGCKQNLGVALASYGVHTKKPELVDQAIEASRTAAAIYDRKGSVEHHLSALGNTAIFFRKRGVLNEDPADIRTALEICDEAQAGTDQDTMPSEWSDIQHIRAESLTELARLQHDERIRSEALSAWRELLLFNPNNSEAKQQLEALQAKTQLTEQLGQ